MGKEQFKDTHVFLDDTTRKAMNDITSWSQEASGISRVIRVIVRKYRTLLARQIEVEKVGGRLVLVQVAPDGKELARDSLDLKM